MDMSQPFSALVRQRENMLHEASHWSTEALTYRSSKRAWSALELIDHLARVEETAACGIRQSLKRDERRSGRGTLQQWILFTIMRSPMRVSVPKESPELIPSMPPSLESAASRWIAAHDGLVAASEGVGEQQEARALFRHPIGGWMSMPTTAAFLVLHLHHHRHQWNRLRKAVA